MSCHGADVRTEAGTNTPVNLQMSLSFDHYAAVAGLYDSVPFYSDRADVGFYVECAVASGGPVLELGCGTGRVMIPIAKAGVEITGIDASHSMLSSCGSRLAAESPSVRSRATLLLSDMRRFHLRRTFALATIPFRSFQHLCTVEEQLRCLKNVCLHLQPNARLILDVFNPKEGSLSQERMGRELHEDQRFTTVDGDNVLRRHRVVSHDLTTQVTHREFIYYVTGQDGRTERVVHTCHLRSTSPTEMQDLLRHAGFELEKVYTHSSGLPFPSGHAGELVFVARRTML